MLSLFLKYIVAVAFHSLSCKKVYGAASGRWEGGRTALIEYVQVPNLSRTYAKSFSLLIIFVDTGTHFCNLNILSL